MILPRLTISKILVEVYNALEDKKIVNVIYNEGLVCIDGISKKVYSPCKPVFMLPNLFQCWRVNEHTWTFKTTVLYNQLIGKDVSSNPDIVYLSSRYQNIKDRVKHYPDFVINK